MKVRRETMEMDDLAGNRSKEAHLKKRSFARLCQVIRDHLGLNVGSIHPAIFRKTYVKNASVRNCDGHCCRGGTTVSVAERDRVLAHASIVSGQMTSRARRDTSRWFGARTRKDDDFTAGATTNTRVVDGACVFYRTDGLCALQLAGDKHLGSPYALKPAVCLLWPLCVDGRALQTCYAWFTRRKECCAPVRKGHLSILEVMVPDEALIARISRREHSRGGGPPDERGRPSAAGAPETVRHGGSPRK